MAEPIMLLILENLTLTNALLLGGLIIVTLSKVADYRGWTRSPALVRQENADLRERNATLAAEVERLDKLDREKAQQIAGLEARIEELTARDQAAVLHAIAKHEENQTAREVEMKTIVTSMTDVLREIRDSLKTGISIQTEGGA
jgi:cell division protein FtsB